MRWTDVSPNPNSVQALNYRRAQLNEAFTDFRGQSRIDVLLSIVKGRKVLDLGAVDHFASAANSPEWLHQHIARAADEALAADIDEGGVRELERRGYKAIQLDVSEGPARLRTVAPFDVVVAGELIEHLDRPLDLFRLSAEVLSPTGKLVITTPNPYSPWRARAGQLGAVWENVDHLTYAFPSGISELADRAGLRLATYGSVGAGPYASDGRVHAWRDVLRPLGASVKRALLRQHSRPGRGDTISLAEAIVLTTRPRAMLGETAIYILERARAE